MNSDKLQLLFENFHQDSLRILDVAGSKAESSLYSQLESFLSAAFSEVHSAADLLLAQQIGADEIGIPDYRVERKKELLGWIEFKAVVGKPLDNLKGHDKDQLERFSNGLHNMILTNGWEWRLYQDGRQVGSDVVLGSRDLFDRKTSNAFITKDQIESLGNLLSNFLSASLSPYKSARDAVTALAARAKGIKSAFLEVGEDGAGEMILSLQNDFRGLLYKNGQKFTWERFIDSYVQIAAFGVLLWRLESKQEVSLDKNVGLKHGVHPLLAQCLQILWAPQSRLPVLEPLLEELCRTINLIDPVLFQVRDKSDGSKFRYVPDPIVHAYEPFFSVYDSASRDANGVYYTPVQVVDRIISGVDNLLRQSLDRKDGILDEEAQFLDPATGTGTFILGLANAVARRADDMGLPVDQLVKSVITEHFAAFELFPGPYTIAHQRVEALLENMGSPATERLPIYLADTLAAPAAGQLGLSKFGLAGAEIIKEREAADKVKTAKEILVILGNPPYERIRKTAGGFDSFAAGLHEEVVAATPLDQRKNLKSAYDLFVFFWAWALWAMQGPESRSLSLSSPKIDTRQANGIVAFVTNRTWLSGDSLIGLRSLIKRGVKEVWIQDLGGDGRGGAGAKTFAGGDSNVFDIQTGVAIAWLVFDRDWDGQPEVWYQRTYGSKRQKLEGLSEAFDRSTFVQVDVTAPSAPFVPADWRNEALASAPTLWELFGNEPETGFQSARDTANFPPLGVSNEDVFTVVKKTATQLKSGSLSDEILGGSLGRWADLNATQRQAEWSTAQSSRAKRKVPNPEDLSVSKLRKVLYRPFDWRVIYDDPSWIDWYRDDLHELFSSEYSPALVTLTKEQGAGPAVIHSSLLPDQHSFKGSGGGKAVFPLWRTSAESSFSVHDPRAVSGGRLAGLSSKVLDWLDDLNQTGNLVGAYDYILATLSAPAYTETSWRALEADQLRVPLTPDQDVFTRGAKLGEAVRKAWDRNIPTDDSLFWRGDVSSRPLGKASHSGQRLTFANGREIVGVTKEVWDFSVSTYSVLPNWLKARQHWTLSLPQAKEITVVIRSIRTLVDLAGPLNNFFHELTAEDGPA